MFSFKYLLIMLTIYRNLLSSNNDTDLTSNSRVPQRRNLWSQAPLCNNSEYSLWTYHLHLRRLYLNKKLDPSFSPVSMAMSSIPRLLSQNAKSLYHSVIPWRKCFTYTVRRLPEIKALKELNTNIINPRFHKQWDNSKSTSLELIA